MPFIRVHEVHASSGVYVSGAGAENIGMANTRVKPADESNGLCENTNTKNEKKSKRNGNCNFPIFLSGNTYPIKLGKWESREVS